MVTGSYPPDTCGVGDYTHQLKLALHTRGVQAELIYGVNWDMAHFKTINRKVCKMGPDLIHIQYPTVGYGSGLTPQLLCISNSCIVTLHEVSQAHYLRKFSLYLFFIFAKHLIFTSLYEQDYASKLAPWIRRKSSIIPIGSNIRHYSHSSIRKNYCIGYFGIIGPGKGLEQVIVLAKLIKDNSLDFNIYIIGLPNPNVPDYYQELRLKSGELPIIWKVGLAEEEVAELLSEIPVAYMPFPDGVSERRSSLLALLANGVVTITTKGRHTTRGLEEIVLFSDSPEDTIDILKRLFNNDRERRRLSENGKRYCVSRSWVNIAEKHIELYRKLYKLG